MSHSIQCPICGKEGIPDFHREDVVCPCCGSDLFIYNRLREVTEIQPESSNVKLRSKWLFLGTISLLLIFIIITCYITYSKFTHKEAEITKLQNKVSELQDSIQNLNTKLSKSTSTYTFTDIPETNYRIYIVEKGDCLRGISHKQLGTELRFEEIASLNNLVSTDVIHPGDTLKIPTQ